MRGWSARAGRALPKKKSFLLKAAIAAGAGSAALAAIQRRSDDLSGEVAIVTGSSRGLGPVIARELARISCPLVICARDGDQLNQAADQLPAASR